MTLNYLVCMAPWKYNIFRCSLMYIGSIQITIKLLSHSVFNFYLLTLGTHLSKYIHWVLLLNAIVFVLEPSKIIIYNLVITRDRRKWPIMSLCSHLFLLQTQITFLTCFKLCLLSIFSALNRMLCLLKSGGWFCHSHLKFIPLSEFSGFHNRTIFVSQCIK